jgi:nicotinamide-nucleotide amidase
MQADFPQGAQPIPNPHGTAPGIAISVERTGRTPCSVFALPGVPAEMHAMWEESVLPAIHRLETSPRVTRHCRVKCFGVGESHLEAMLPDLIRRGREPRVGITVSDATITLRITASAATEAECFAAMDPTVATIHESLGDLVFGAEDDELEHAVVRLLNEKKLTLATAEWATEGLLAQWLSEVTGGKPPLLKATIVASSEKFGAAEPHAAATALAMAERVREEAGSDWGLAVAAYPADVDTADAHVCAAIATAERTRKLRFPTAAHPAILRSRTAKQALNALRLTLLGKV